MNKFFKVEWMVGLYHDTRTERLMYSGKGVVIGRRPAKLLKQAQKVACERADAWLKKYHPELVGWGPGCFLNDGWIQELGSKEVIHVS